MADTTEAAADAQLTFKVKASGDKNHQITMAETATILDLKTKLASEEFENIPVERQRLIYSGRVMKNEDTLASYKVKSGHTIHLVKSAASNPTPPASGSTSTPAAVPTNMSAGTANNVLAGLTGARYAGHVNLPSRDIFGADGGMGAPPNEEQLANMMSDPATAQALNEALDNPAFLDHLVNSNPYLRNMPNARELFRSPILRGMLSNPDYIRQAMRLQRQLGGGGGLGGAGGFPAPGATNTTPAGAPASGTTAGANPNATMPPNPFAMGMDPFAAMFGPGAAGAAAGQGGAAGSSLPNPFAALFGQPTAPAAAATGQAPATPGIPGTTAASGNAAAPRGAEGAAAAGTTGGAPQDAANPFASLFGPPQMTPEMMQQMMQMWGAMGGPGAVAAAPPDNRPPEERYADQLRQLNDMGFFDFDRNVAALRRSGGSVQGAIEHLLSG